MYKVKTFVCGNQLLSPTVSSKTTSEKSKSRQSKERSRFQRAFSRSLSERTRVLKRRLTRAEWTALKAAVKSQISFRSDRKLSRHVQLLAKKIDLIEKNLQCVVQPFTMLEEVYHRINDLRSVVLSQIEEQSQTSETCSHAAHKTKIYLNESNRVYGTIPGLGSISVMIGPGQQVLCCRRCHEGRVDNLFLRCGSNPQLRKPSVTPEPDSLVVEGRELENLVKRGELQPLQFQPIWSAILDRMFDR